MTAPKKGLTKDELYAQLATWDLAAAPGSEGAAANVALSERLWAEWGKKRAVLVSDLSGFTRITRQKGLLQFLAIFERAREIGAKAFERHGGRYLKHEADNLIALFDTTGAAAAAARSMLWEAQQLNAQIPDPTGQVSFCFGISFGFILELADDAFGDAVNVAFKLGEDIAHGGDILLSEEASQELSTSRTHADLFALLEPGHPIDLSGVVLNAHRLPPRGK